MTHIKSRKSLREQSGNKRERNGTELFPVPPLPVGEGPGTSPTLETLRATHDPSPWLTREMAEEIAESMPTGYDARGYALIPPRKLTVEQYREWLTQEVERWGGYVWWVGAV